MIKIELIIITNYNSDDETPPIRPSFKKKKKSK
mgnify:FL=1|jgi:hypothetical protein